jgi:hypothetical protein
VIGSGRLDPGGLAGAPRGGRFRRQSSRLTLVKPVHYTRLRVQQQHRRHDGGKRSNGGGMSDRYQQRAAIEAAPLEDGMILLDPETNQFSVLNQTASAIWTRLAQAATSEEVTAEVASRFAEVTEGEARSDVDETLRQMVERKLITRV